MPLEMGFSAFVTWSMTDNFTLFNEHLRWSGWEAEVAALPLDQALNTYPPPYTVEGQDLSKVSRRPIPLREQMGSMEDVALQLQGQDAKRQRRR
jgi:hypothetical protein